MFTPGLDSSAVQHVGEPRAGERGSAHRSEEHTSELQSPCNLVCRLLLEKKKRAELRDERDKRNASNVNFRIVMEVAQALIRRLTRLQHSTAYAQAGSNRMVRCAEWHRPT